VTGDRAARPLEYELRESPRARRIRLRVVPGRPVLVTVPRGVSRREAERFVADSAEWIARARSRVEGEAALLAERRAEPIPTVIALPGIRLRYIVERHAGTGGAVRASERAGRVLLSGAVDDEEACRAALRRWVRRVASRELAGMVATLAARTGLTPGSVSVTWPRARWGSCSARGDVRVSVDLAFLPPELARAVILHELAHLRVHDHSSRFWGTLAALDPECAEHRADLRRARAFIPGWALPGA
jgi:predicted metal-dependent hydrolase